jgi:predicted nucleic-acid-binding protein
MYSTLCLIASQGERNGFSTVVTFDQQLWWKAMLAIENDILECRVKQDV